MKNIFLDYIQSISAKFAHRETSEMGYRADFEILLKGIFESIKVERIDHDAKAVEGNKPDFVVIKNSVPIMYIEVKDIGVSLDKVEKSEQMARYYGYKNLVLTDYVEFRFYRNGLRYEDPIKIADYYLKNRTIVPLPQNYEHVAKSLLDFTQSQKEPIRFGAHLAKIMGGKAQRIRNNVRQFLTTENDQNAVYSITLNKLRVYEELARNKSRVYNFIARQVFDRIPFEQNNGDRIILTIDKCKGKKGIREFNEYIIGQLEGRLPPNTPFDIYHEDSKKIGGLQAVDMFAWGIHRKHEFNDDGWYKIFNKKIALDEQYLK